MQLDGGALSNGKAEHLLAELRQSLKPGRDEIRVVVDLQGRAGRCELMLPGRYDTSPPAQASCRPSRASWGSTNCRSEARFTGRTAKKGLVSGPGPVL